MIKYFEEKILVLIKKPFKLVTSFSDWDISLRRNGTLQNNLLTILNNKFLIKWYGMNVNYDHHKLTSLPIGLEDLYFQRVQVSKILELNQNYNCKKDILLYISYFGLNHKYCNRHKATQKLLQKGFKQSEHKSWNSYIEDIHRSKFVFCQWY